ncbi:MAG: hypothetical protein MUF49_07330 [Oculatellaceae cyanobacterium Prado106]|jgi:hypothetical protein|nr:hypothetical protein [Oculatellaceae cyanobacterium Prado106]
MQEVANHPLWMGAEGRLVAKCRTPHFGILGSCIPQPKAVVDEVCRLQSGTNYAQTTANHRSGQNTVIVVRSALEVLPGLQILQTPPNSLADVYWKWDLMVRFQDHFYPIQVKSGMDDIWKCQGQLLSRIQEIEDEVEWIEKSYMNRIHQIMVKYGWETWENKAIAALKDECDGKREPLKKNLNEYKNRLPLFIWASENENTVAQLTHIFADGFGVQGSRVTLSQRAIALYRKARVQPIKPMAAKPTDLELTPFTVVSVPHSITRFDQSDFAQTKTINPQKQTSGSSRPNSVHDVRQRYPRSYVSWTIAEDQRLRLRFCQCSSLQVLGAEFGRKPGAIRARLKKLKLL